MVEFFGTTTEDAPAVVYNYMPEYDHMNIAFVSLDYLAKISECNAQDSGAEITQWLNAHDKQSPPKVVICGAAEGFDTRVPAFVELLVDKIGISCCDILYMSGAMPTQANTAAFRSQVKYPIKILYVSRWPCLVVGANKNIKHWALESRAATAPKKTFLCYNGAMRAHRLALLYQLHTRDLISGALVSAMCPGGTELMKSQCAADLETFFPDLDPCAADTLTNEVVPLTLDFSSTDLLAQSSNNVNADHFESSRFSVIPETTYPSKVYQRASAYPTLPCAFATEKTYKAIFARHPFIILSTPGFLENLRSLGYKTFSPHIDESYDLITDDQQRMNAVVDEVQRLAAMDDDQWMQIQTQVEHILEHNVNHLINNDEYVTKSWILTQNCEHVTIDSSQLLEPRQSHERTLD